MHSTSCEAAVSETSVVGAGERNIATWLRGEEEEWIELVAY